MLLEKVQTQLECLYGIGLAQRANDFLINREETLRFIEEHPNSKIPKELFLVRKNEEDTVEVALFLDHTLMSNLEKNNPLISLNEKNLSDFCILIEGVSHFVYFLWKAQQDLPITQLELELQAEIDKFLMLFFFLRTDSQPHCPQKLFDALFEDFHLIESLSTEQQDRYLTATTLASRYCYKLQKNFRSVAKLQELVQEVRLFYHYSQAGKIEHILH